MHQEIVSWSLPDDLEVVHKGGLEAYFAVVRALGLACCLILVTGCQTRAAYSLRLEMKRGVETTDVIKRSAE